MLIGGANSDYKTIPNLVVGDPIVEYAFPKNMEHL